MSQLNLCEIMRLDFNVMSYEELHLYSATLRSQEMMLSNAPIYVTLH